MDLRRLRYFSVIAAEGSFRRAAECLNITQPALSRHIQELEEELGVKLFARHSHGVELSAAGKVLNGEVQELLRHVESIEWRTRRAAQGQFGTLKIGFSTVAAEIPPAMAAFAEARRAFPDVDFQFVLVESDRQLDALDRQAIDLGILYRHAINVPGYAYLDLRLDRYLLAVPNNHPLNDKSAIRLADLQNEKMIFASPTARPITYHQIMAAFQRGGLVPQIVLESTSEVVTLNMIAEGLGIGVVNSSIAQRRSLNGVSLLPIQDLDVQLPLSAVWKENHRPPALKHFVKILVAHLCPEIALPDFGDDD